MQKNKNFTKQLCINAVMIALFYLLDMTSIRIGNNMKITFSGLPVIISALYYGPVAGMTVGLVGSFLGQLAGYGITATTILWILPAGIRGLMVGACARGFDVCFEKGRILHEVKLSDMFKAPAKSGGVYRWVYDNIIWKVKLYPVLTMVIILSSLVVTAVNSGVIYLDSKIYGYYYETIVTAMLVWRIISSIITAVVHSVIVPLLLKPLNKAIGVR